MKQKRDGLALLGLMVALGTGVITFVGVFHLENQVASTTRQIADYLMGVLLSQDRPRLFIAGLATYFVVLALCFPKQIAASLDSDGPPSVISKVGSAMPLIAVALAAFFGTIGGSVALLALPGSHGTWFRTTFGLMVGAINVFVVTAAYWPDLVTHHRPAPGARAPLNSSIEASMAAVVTTTVVTSTVIVGSISFWLWNPSGGGHPQLYLLLGLLSVTTWAATRQWLGKAVPYALTYSVSRLRGQNTPRYAGQLAVDLRPVMYRTRRLLALRLRLALPWALVEVLCWGLMLTADYFARVLDPPLSADAFAVEMFLVLPGMICFAGMLGSLRLPYSSRSRYDSSTPVA